MSQFKYRSIYDYKLKKCGRKVLSSLSGEMLENCSDTMKWQLNGNGATRFLKEILPYMRVKHQQALLAIQFQDTTKKHWRKMEVEDYENQKQLCLALKQAKVDLKIGKPLKEI